jgi:hypothetical protein
MSATDTEAAAVEKTHTGQTLTNSDHQSLHRLRKKLANNGLTEQYEELMDPGWLPPRPAAERKQRVYGGQRMLVPLKYPTLSRQAKLFEGVPHAEPVTQAMLPAATSLLQPVHDAGGLPEEPAAAARKAVA